MDIILLYTICGCLLWGDGEYYNTMRIYVYEYV